VHFPSSLLLLLLLLVLLLPLLQRHRQSKVPPQRALELASMPLAFQMCCALEVPLAELLVNHRVERVVEIQPLGIGCRDRVTIEAFVAEVGSHAA
jgi:hypothetical protein